MDKKINIVISKDVFNNDKERARLSDEKRQYDSDIAKMNKAVEALDRFDDFASLKIPAGQYEANGSGYGITALSTHPGDGVIYDHQKKAALEFLKDLRGFGLLADVVGSGKTYEAGVVLSELAARNKIKSLLFVVPEQVYSSWIEVMEQKFGMGNGVLVRLGKNPHEELEEIPYEKLSNGIRRPLKPAIVTMEEFAEWPDSSDKWLFDAVVVDEAHHLCVEEGRYASVMKLLSLLMKTKQKENVTYCLLLSATPHSGNLEHMFRLWYFIRCKGGNPSDFEVKEDKARTDEYRKEKEYYKRHICRGASTVMEFIKKVKYIEVASDSGYHKKAFKEWLTQKNINVSNYTESETVAVIDRFLKENPLIKEDVIKRVASAYHNGVLRPIMIRQPNKLSKRKQVVNYLFYPTDKQIGIIDTWGLSNEKIRIDASNLYGDNAVTVNCGKANEKQVSLETYIEENRGERLAINATAEVLVSGVLSKLDPKDDEIFPKKNSIKYYWEQMANLPNDVAVFIQPYQYNPTDLFAHKFAKTVELIEKHKDERVIVFFDYDLIKSNEKTMADTFIEQLSQIAAVKDRIIIATKNDKVGTEQAFNNKKDAVLIVTTADFTEGVNLQKSSVVINFEVSPDPLAMDQRVGRVFRLGQSKDVIIYSLADMNRLEGYVLMYFARIGLLSSNSGDATIIAGSNNERMVTVRCSKCGNVKLFDQEEYEKQKKMLEEGNTLSSLYCNTISSLCVDEDNPYGTKMEEISVYDFKCTTCSSVFTRSVTQEGYLCMSINNVGRGIMCNSGEQGDRQVYCRKICAISHCKKFLEGDMKGKCEALKVYNSNKNISDSKLMEICENCKSRSKCLRQCWVNIGKDAINACSSCSNATCSPKPHVIDFDEKWEASCPICEKNGKSGKIKPIIARTFATYIRSAWDFKHDGGSAFCDNLGAEAEKTAMIKNILQLDELDKK